MAMSDGVCGCGACTKTMWGKAFSTVATLTLVVLMIFLGTKVLFVREQTRHVGRADVPQPTISISGMGKVEAVPNVATIHLGFIGEGSDLSVLLRDNTEKMNRLIDAMKQLGVAEKDIQSTNYSIYPKYDYPDGRSILSGYTVNQNATVKVRDLAKAGAVFAKAGEIGANQVNGPEFTIDDPSVLEAEAREKAITDARAKAETLARTLGMSLGRIVGFSEGGSAPAPYYYDRAMAAEGMGGGTPKIEPGELTIMSNVSIQYEIQ